MRDCLTLKSAYPPEQAADRRTSTPRHPANGNRRSYKRRS